ncbi:MAG: glycine--tRNA ligase subunit beta [candidate division WOR-3 bacterium]
MDRDVLIEIGTEEIPAGYLENAINSFEKGLKDVFCSNGISYSSIEKFYTPRRLALIVKNVKKKKEKKINKIKGPPAHLAFKDGKPTEMAKGFASSKGVSIDSLKIEEIDGNKYVVAEILEKPKKVEEILKENLLSLIKNIEFPKKMRWEETGFAFARPIRWLIVMFGEKVISLSIAGVRSSNTTFGHRLLSFGKIKVTPKNYEEKLEKAFVIANPEKRKRLLKSLIEREAKKLGASPIFSVGLLEEVSNLIEYPFVILGSFQEEFLKLPEGVIISAMETHQRYFPLKKNGKLIPYFISGINNKPTEEIIKGNERVLTARLEDAKFYWEVDNRLPIRERIQSLSGIKWHKNLGNLLDRTKRLVELSEWIGKILDGINLEVLKEGAELCKVDLTTLMIRDGKEFTSLEGYIGAEYGRAQGLKEEVCKIIEEHYKPKNVEDTLPTTKEGAVLSLADRIDLMVGSFVAGEKPTGSRDPFGLRQAMNGAIRIVLDFKFSFPMDELIKKSLKLFGVDYKEEIFEEIKQFMIERMEGYLESKNIRYDIAKAVLSEKWNDLLESYLVALAMMEIRKDEKEFEKIVIGQKRVSNILEGVVQGEVKETLLIEKEEKDLFREAKALEPILNNFIKNRQYLEGLKELKKLRPYIDNFFDSVLVMVDDEDLRNNRLALLYYVRGLFHLFCDFEEIVID